MANGVEKFFVAFGHDLKVAFGVGEKVVAYLPKFIKAAEDAGKDTQRIIPLVQNVIAASIALAKPGVAIVSAVGTAGVNLAADEAAITSVIGLAGNLQSELATFVAAVKALAVEIGVDWTHLVEDLTPDATVAAPAVAA